MEPSSSDPYSGSSSRCRLVWWLSGLEVLCQTQRSASDVIAWFIVPVLTSSSPCAPGGSLTVSNFDVLVQGSAKVALRIPEYLAPQKLPHGLFLQTEVMSRAWNDFESTVSRVTRTVFFSGERAAGGPKARSWMAL